MDADRTKLAVRTVVGGFRSARSTAEQIGGEHGAQIKQHAKARAAEILGERIAQAQKRHREVKDGS